MPLGLADVTCASGTSTVIVSASVRDWIHSLWVLFRFQEHQLREKKEEAFFLEIARGPLDCQDVKNSERSSPLFQHLRGAPAAHP